jgi:hypothetical protein
VWDDIVGFSCRAGEPIGLKHDTVSMTRPDGCNLPYSALVNPGIAVDTPIFLHADRTDLTAHAPESRKLDPLTAEDKPPRRIQAGRVKSEEFRISACKSGDLSDFDFSTVGQFAERYLLVGARILKAGIPIRPCCPAQQ